MLSRFGHRNSAVLSAVPKLQMRFHSTAEGSHGTSDNVNNAQDHQQQQQLQSGAQHQQQRRHQNNNFHNRQGQGGNYQRRQVGYQQHYQQPNIPEAVAQATAVDVDSLPDDLKVLEVELAKKYGPLSQLQTRFDRRGQRFKAQATFRQCGFAVELATGVGETAVAAAKVVLAQALQLDIMFLDPRIRVATASSLIAHTKGTFDELRQICTNAGRMIKFSVVPNPEEGGKGWAVRSFVRDDWAAISQLVPLVEVLHESANKALNDNAFQVLETYRAEFSSPEVVKEDYLELSSHLWAFHQKKLIELCTEDQATRTFSVSIQVSDEFDNSYQVQSKGHRHIQAAYSHASKSVFKIEFDAQANQRPLLSQVRWQVDAMSLAIYGSTVRYREEKVPNAIHGQLIVDENIVISESNKPSSSAYQQYVGKVLAEETGQGSVLLELKCYVRALKDMIREHPEVAAANRSLHFLREQDVDEAVARYNDFDIMNIHRGKWNPFSVLGTLTSSLLGTYYQSEFEEVPEGFHISTRSHILINDGERATRPLISRLAKDKQEAWRLSCNDAIRDNFPSIYEKLLKVDEYAVSITRLEGQSAKHKGVPRDQRVPHFSTLFSMLQAFCQEDFTWTQMQLISVQNTRTQQWMGELHVLEAGKSRCIFQSDSFPNGKLARKFACYAVAKKHYPKETSIYCGLNRGDYFATDEAQLDKLLSRTYDSRRPLTDQICELIEKTQPNLKPVSWKLQNLDNSGRQRATVYSRDSPLADVAGEPLETAVSTLQRALISACKAVGAPSQNLMEEYMMTAPANVSNERDLASYLFFSFLGKLPQVSSVFVKPHWVQTLTIELNDGSRVLLHRSEHENKKEGIIQAYILGAKHSFTDLLKNIATTPCDMMEIAKAMLERSGHQISLDGSVASESEVIGARRARMVNVGNQKSASQESTRTSDNNDANVASSSESGTAPRSGNAPVSKAQAFLNDCMVKYDALHQLSAKIEVLSNGHTKVTFTRSDGKRHEIAGTGMATTPSEAIHNAAVAVLENFFDTHLALELEKDPELCDFAPSS